MGKTLVGGSPPPLSLSLLLSLSLCATWKSGGIKSERYFHAPRTRNEFWTDMTNWFCLIVSNVTLERVLHNEGGAENSNRVARLSTTTTTMFLRFQKGISFRAFVASVVFTCLAQRGEPRILIARDTWFFLSRSRAKVRIYTTLGTFDESHNLFRLNFTGQPGELMVSFPPRNTLYYQPVRWKFRRKTNKHRQDRAANKSCDSSSQYCATWLLALIDALICNAKGILSLDD